MRRAGGVTGVVLGAVLAAAGLAGCGGPPQMGNDEDVFHAVDALFTAVTARDAKLLGSCEQRLNALKEAGKLPGEASASLDGIIRRAREGHWESAAKRLYDFMKGQRREGPWDHPAKKQKGRPPAGPK